MAYVKKHYESVFHNTTHEEGDELKKYKFKAVTQDQKVLDFFKKHPAQSFTPCDVEYARIFDDNVPLTSIRRSMTNLERAGKLEKTNEKREGIYGRSNYCWKLFIPKTPVNYEQGNLFEP